MDYSQEMIAELIKCRDDFQYFMKYFDITSSIDPATIVIKNQ